MLCEFQKNDVIDRQHVNLAKLLSGKGLNCDQKKNLKSENSVNK